jgi:hypothetical protein
MNLYLNAIYFFTKTNLFINLQSLKLVTRGFKKWGVNKQ